MTDVAARSPSHPKKNFFKVDVSAPVHPSTLCPNSNVFFRGHRLERGRLQAQGVPGPPALSYATTRRGRSWGKRSQISLAGNNGSWGQISKHRHHELPQHSPQRPGPLREDPRGRVPPSEPRAAQCAVADSRKCWWLLAVPLGSHWHSPGCSGP